MPHSNGFDFLEPLPDTCPPSDVVVPTQKTLWRLIKAGVATEADFDSQRKRLPSHPYPDECLARSVSLVTTLAACRAVVKSPRMLRMKFSHAIEVQCDPAYGVWHKDGETHVNWWPYKSVNPLSVAKDVEQIDG